MIKQKKYYRCDDLLIHDHGHSRHVVMVMVLVLGG